MTFPSQAHHPSTSFNLRSLDLELSKIGKTLGPKKPTVSLKNLPPKNILFQKEKSPINGLITELENDVTAKLKSLSVLQKIVTIIAKRKIAEVRTACYSDIQNFTSGHQAVLTLVSNMFELIDAKNQCFPDIPEIVLVRALEELLDPTRSLLSVKECLVGYQNTVSFCPERLNALPKEFHVVITRSIIERLEKFAGRFDQHALKTHQQIIDTTFTEWEARKDVLFETLDKVAALRKTLAIPIDSTLEKIAAEHFLHDDLDECLYLECKKAIITFYQAELHRYGLSFFNTVPYFPKINKISSCTLAAHLEQKKQLFYSITGPNIAISFCKILAQKNYTLENLLDVYQNFFSRWETLAEFTLEEALKTLDCCHQYSEANYKEQTHRQKLALVPEVKIQVCQDARKWPIHLKNFDKQKLFQEIPLSTITHPAKTTPAAETQFSQEGVLGASISFTHSSMQGRREEMEDAELITTITLSNGDQCPLFTLMDGHGSSITGEFLKQVLAPTLQTWLNTALQESTQESNQESNQEFCKESSNLEVAIRNAIKIGMIQLNTLLKHALGSLVSYSGSSAIFSFIFKDLLFTVTVGDSRAVLSSGYQLSVDANDSSPLHVNKIMKRGGVIDEEKRVDGYLVYSTFGDFGALHLSSFAQTHIYKLPDRPIRLLLACDGVTDVFASPELIQMLQKGLKASEIVFKAFKEGSTDNLSAIVVDIPASGLPAPITKNGSARLLELIGKMATSVFKLIY